jgi:hypothetical protein
MFHLPSRSLDEVGDRLALSRDVPHSTIDSNDAIASRLLACTRDPSADDKRILKNLHRAA